MMVILSILGVIGLGLDGGSKGPTMAHAEEKLVSKVIYGEDNRHLVPSEVPDAYKELALRLSNSVAMRVFHDDLITTSDQKEFYVRAGDLRNRYSVQLCSEQKYTNLPIVGACTGFLVGENLLVTAGHCVVDKMECAQSRWIFNFIHGQTKVKKVQNLQQRFQFRQEYQVNFPVNDVYSCKKIIRRAKDDELGLDFALIELDRKAVGQQALSFRTEGKIADDAPIAAIGHSNGLPQVLSLGAFVRSNDHRYHFFANLDVFTGNSGSPVVNLQTGLVEGILSGGEKDFLKDLNRGCRKVKRCLDSACDGEKVIRITSLPELMPATFDLAEVLQFSETFEDEVQTNNDEVPVEIEEVGPVTRSKMNWDMIMGDHFKKLNSKLCLK